MRRRSSASARAKRIALRVRREGERRDASEALRAGGQFVAHIAALPGNPYDGHTLANVVPAMQALLGNVLDRIIADAGYRGHNAPAEHRFRVYTAGQKRRLNSKSNASLNVVPPSNP